MLSIDKNRLNGSRRVSTCIFDRMFKVHVYSSTNTKFARVELGHWPSTAETFLIDYGLTQLDR